MLLLHPPTETLVAEAANNFPPITDMIDSIDKFGVPTILAIFGGYFIFIAFFGSLGVKKYLVTR